MPAPIVPGHPEISVAALTDPDLDELLPIAQAEERASGQEVSITRQSLEEQFTSPRAVDRTVAYALRLDGSLVAVWAVYRNTDEKYLAQVTVDRDQPADVVDTLCDSGLAWSASTAVEQAAQRGDGPPRLDAGAADGDELTARHLREHGFSRDRAFIEMQMALGSYVAPPTPAGVTVRPADLTVVDGPDARLTYDIISQSFRDHYDYAERTFDDWLESRASGPLAALDRWYIAEADGVPVGAIVENNGYLELANAAYIGNLGVLRAGRGRGVAKALLYYAFSRAQSDGRSAVKLHVDAESPTGATQLYESVGMQRRHIWWDYHKQL